MKYKLRMFSLFSILMMSHTLYAQKGDQPYRNREYYIPEMNRDIEEMIRDIELKRDSMLNNADYIFEGVVLRDKYAVDGYYNRDKSMIYSSLKIKITKILRGKDDLKLGTILLLREGGTIVDYKNGEMHFLDHTPIYQLRKMSYFSSNMQLFICNKSDFPDNPRNIQVDNPQRVQFFYDKKYWEMIYDKTFRESYIGLRGMSFSSIDELYHFLKKYKNITTRETKDRGQIRKERKALEVRQDSLQKRHDEIKKKQEDWLKFLKENVIDKNKKEL